MSSSTKTDPKPKRSHTLPPTTPLSQQVGGHAGVHTTEDHSLLFKPTLPREIAFYQFVRDITDASTGLHPLKAWIPNFLGVLNLEGRLADPTAEIEPGTVPDIIPTSEGNGTSGDLNNNSDRPKGTSQTLVLQNLLYGYRKPCILDVKLGTVLYDDDASEKKKARLIKKAAETTSLQTGIRLTGFQVYSNDSPDPVVYKKAYGYGLKPEQLPEGIENFFPCSTPISRIVDDSKSPESNSSAGLPPDVLQTLLTSLHSTLIDLRKDLSGAQLRMVGGSVLIIYEGDWERAVLAAGRGGGPGDLEDLENEDDDEDQIEVEIDENGRIIMDSIPSTVDESSSESSESEIPPRLFTVSLIDFAHTRVALGEGPDQGLLTGMDTLIRLVDQRRQDVAAMNGRKGQS